MGGFRPDGSVSYYPVDSDLVCVESEEADELGLHEILYGSISERGQLAPNTLLELTKVYQPGEWESPVPGVYPMRKVYVLRATYRPPRSAQKR